MSKHTAREYVLKVIFSHHFKENDLIPEDHPLNASTKIYANQLLDTIKNHQENIDKKIEQVSHHWKIDRLFLVDKMILRMAIAEFFYMEDKHLDKEVIINEALELAKKYSEEKSYAFINGVLDHAFQEKNESTIPRN